MMKKPAPPKSPEMNNGKNAIEAKNSQIAYEMISKWGTVLDRG
jgi:hypothetical protein